MSDTPTSLLDPIKNFQKATMSGTITATNTRLYVKTGEGSRFPNPTSNGSFNVTIWQVNTYPDPCDDPKKEIQRVTSRTGDTFTITRPSSTNTYNNEGTSNVAQTHSQSGQTYQVQETFSKKMKDDIELGLAAVGLVSQYTSSVAPTGWLICNGDQKSRTTYSKLFSVIGTLYGAGNGSTTFNIPDTRGRVIVGLSTTDTGCIMAGQTGGEKTHQLSINEMPSHGYGHVSSFSFTQILDDSVGFPQTIVTDITLEALGGDQPHNNMQPYITLYNIIKY